MSVNATNFCIPQKGQARKGNPLERGAGEDEGEEWLGRTMMDDSEDKNEKREGTRDDNKGGGRMRTKHRENDEGQQGRRKREGVRNRGEEGRGQGQ